MIETNETHFVWLPFGEPKTKLDKKFNPILKISEHENLFWDM